MDDRRARRRRRLRRAARASLLEAAREYHRRRSRPREAMWRAIQAERRLERGPPAGSRAGGCRGPLAAAAVLALGIGIGRLSAADGPTGRRAGDRGGPRRGAAGQRDRLPAGHARAPGPVGGLPHAVPRLGADAAGRSGSPRRPRGSCSPPTGCCSTRPAGQDRRTRVLLEDLELVLAEIAQLSPEAPAGRPRADPRRHGARRGALPAQDRRAGRHDPNPR